MHEAMGSISSTTQNQAEQKFKASPYYIVNVRNLCYLWATWDYVSSKQTLYEVLIVSWACWLIPIIQAVRRQKYEDHSWFQTTTTKWDPTSNPTKNGPNEAKRKQKQKKYKQTKNPNEEFSQTTLYNS